SATAGRHETHFSFRPDLLALLVGAVEHRLRAGTAATRLHLAAIDHHGVAVDVGRPVAHEERRKVRELDVLADAAQRDHLHQLLAAAAFLGHQPTPRSLRAEKAGHDRAGPDS